MPSSSMPPALSEQALRLLREITREQSDGYTLMSRSGLKGSDFEKAVGELRDHSLIEVKGDISGERLGESVFYVPLNAQGRADFLLGRFGSSRSAAW